MKFILIFFILCNLSTNVFALPEGSWPEYMRGSYLPSPKWVLVIPARRNDNGTITVWNKEDQWSREWVVPKKTPSGIKTIAISGDSEDQRIVSGYHIDNMNSRTLSIIAKKYGASSIAIAVTDNKDIVAVAAWSRGRDATWQSGRLIKNPRYDALYVIDEIYSSNEQVGQDNLREFVPQSNSIRIIADRKQPGTNKMEYRIEGNREVLDAVRASKNIVIIAEYEDTPTILDIRIMDDRSIEDTLFNLGVNLD